MLIYRSVLDQEIVSLLGRIFIFFSNFVDYVIFTGFIWSSGIGQKFALLEEKSVLSAVLRNYELEACQRREDITLRGELILRPKDGLPVRIKPRAPYAH